MADDSFEVIVVDNGSRDETRSVASCHGARVITEPVASRARARNAGARAARAPKLAFIDAECHAEPEWLASLADCLETAPLAGGAVVIDSSSTPNVVERFERLWRFHQEENVTQGGWSVSANLGVGAAVFAQIGGFDPFYRAIGEDVDLCLRARAAGHTIVWCPDAVIHHPAETELRAVWGRALRQGIAGEQQHQRTHGRYGPREWRHPGALFYGDWALRRLGIDPAALDLSERRRMLVIARFEYVGRMLGGLRARFLGGKSAS